MGLARRIHYVPNMTFATRWRSLVFVMLVAAMPACRKGRTATTSAAPIGTWTEIDGQAREYVFGSDNTFTMKMTPGLCLDGGAGQPIVSSGLWAIEGNSLVLSVKESSDSILGGSTMIEEIVERTGEQLVLRSSVTSCSGQIVRLVRH